MSAASELNQLIEFLRDDLERAERHGRATLNSYAVRYHLERLEAVAKRLEGDHE